MTCTCKPGNPKGDVLIRLHHATSRGFTIGSADPCIAPIVQALNDAGLQTVASCCGHNRQPGRISLEDGREILIVDDDQATRIAGLFPDIHGRE